MSNSLELTIGAHSETVELVIFILIGFFYRIKYADGSAAETLKSLILKIFLPLLIISAFTNVNLQAHLTVYLIFGILYSLVLYLFFTFFLYKIDKNSSTQSLVLVLSTISPGLSVYPFVIAFLGQANLAHIALTDFGEKLYIFIFIFFITHFLISRSVRSHKSHRIKIKFLIKNILGEPVNIALILGVLFVIFEINITDLSPQLAGILTSILDAAIILIMLFIGISFKKSTIVNNLRMIALLFFRSGIGCIFTSGFCYFTKITDKNIILLFAAFSQGAVSFWPYANMIYLNKLYKKEFFNSKLALQVLSYSFLLSLISLLAVFNFKNFITHSLLDLFITGMVITMISVVFYIAINYYKPIQ